ncbi:hypothetical protein AAC387_Pa05g1734 [Persea americana]
MPDLPILDYLGFDGDPSESSTAICSHCEKAIPTSNIDLHYAHCSRFLEKCTICGDLIPKKHAKEHYLNTHAPVPCSLCGEEIEREVLALHKRENCPQRIVTCEYCDFLLPAVDLSKHQEVCGNRPEYCDLCNKYIWRHELNDHEILLHSNSHYIAESSRNWRIPQREQGVPRRPGCNSSKRHILFTIAITGISILIGSMFIQRRPDSHQ